MVLPASVVSHKNVIKNVLVILLGLVFKIRNVFGVRCQVAGVSEPMTEGETA